METRKASELTVKNLGVKGRKDNGTLNELTLLDRRSRRETPTSLRVTRKSY